MQMCLREDEASPFLHLPYDLQDFTDQTDQSVLALLVNIIQPLY
jgi:hypothetical protein